MSLTYEILKSLSDGSFHSGQELATQLSVTRAAVWKAVKSMADKYGIDIHSVHGRGYRLANSIELLDHRLLISHMQHAHELKQLECFLSVESTNHYLMRLATKEQQGPYIVFTEHQTGGKGRRGRQWASPFSGNIYMSLLWRFNHVPNDLMGLSLAVGVSICRVLQRQGIADIKMKWPNDILCRGRKLCGILVEMHGETNGPYAVVIGIGLNVQMSHRDSKLIDQPWIALNELMESGISRNKLAAEISDELLEAMKLFEKHGLESFLGDWSAMDIFKDQKVTLLVADQEIQGIARGVDRQGALLLDQNGKIKRFFSGEVSLRAIA